MYRELRKARLPEINKLAETRAKNQMLQALNEGKLERRYHDPSSAKDRFMASGMSEDQYLKALDGALMTSLLHMEARVASNIGKGFYTIGPCGEELLGAASLHLHDMDSVALHYRHTANSIVRQLRTRNTEEILLDRARAYTCSSLDPVTHGRHCSIGGGPNEFLVTSTLASQCPPAVGRALGIPLARAVKLPNAPFDKNSISYVSVGDGSTANAHFLAAVNLSKYASFKNAKVPVVFGVSDNNICISLKGTGYLRNLIDSLNIKTFVANGCDMYDVYTQSQQAISYARRYSKPSLLLYTDLPRRFGHAGTDRQFAYLTPSEIEAQEHADPLSGAMSEAVDAGLLSYEELQAKVLDMDQAVMEAFEKASEEPKLTSRDVLVLSNSAPLKPKKEARTAKAAEVGTEAPRERLVMRKLMTAALGEILSREDGKGIYIGEDVEHGGYYLVSDGLKAEHPLRVHDYPPDETTLVGAGMGLSQVGFVPVVELPYAKYLDCGADIFQESLITHWLSDGTQRNGMVYRLQGFDKGVFGGNFHTHNILPFVSSPGLDVMCHSNGANYVKAMRYAYRQAQAGRVVMSVDCTDLLNKRHLRDEDKDGYFLHTFPASEQGEEMSFDEVDVHRLDKDTGKWCAVRGQKAVAEDSSGEIDVVIVTYGNGVPTAMRAAQALMSPGKEEKQRDEKKVPSVAVVDSPYLSAAPAELKILLQASSTAKATVVFADICKQRMGPLSAISVQLHNEQILKGRKWTLVGAADTYNPLGNLVTFLSEADIEEAVNKVI